MARLSEIEAYKELATVHDQILAAAESLDWDLVCELERRSRQLVAGIASMATDIATPVKRKAELIQQILSTQEKIRQEIDAWRSDVQPLLKALAQKTTGS